MKNDITMKDCRDLYQRFLNYTERAEQHEFAMLAMTQTMLEQTLNTWTDPIDQVEARAMFRVIAGRIMGEDITPYLEEEAK